MLTFRIEWNRIFYLERTYNDHLVQLPNQFRADQKLKVVANGIFQKLLEHWQAGGISHLSREPVPVFDHSLSKEMLPNIKSKPPLAQLQNINKIKPQKQQTKEMKNNK